MGEIVILDDLQCLCSFRMVSEIKQVDTAVNDGFTSSDRARLDFAGIKAGAIFPHYASYRTVLTNKSVAHRWTRAPDKAMLIETIMLYDTFRDESVALVASEAKHPFVVLSKLPHSTGEDSVRYVRIHWKAILFSNERGSLWGTGRCRLEHRRRWRLSAYCESGCRRERYSQQHGNDPNPDFRHYVPVSFAEK
jgi:hypothetical protein